MRKCDVRVRENWEDFGQESEKGKKMSLFFEEWEIRGKAYKQVRDKKGGGCDWATRSGTRRNRLFW